MSEAVTSEIKIVINAEDKASAGIKKVTESLKKLQNITDKKTENKSFDTLGDKFSKLTEKINALDTTKVEALVNAISALGSAGSAINNIVRSLNSLKDGTNMQNVAEGLTNIGSSLNAIDADRLERIAEALERIVSASNQTTNSGRRAANAAQNAVSDEPMTQALSTEVRFDISEFTDITSEMRGITEESDGASQGISRFGSTMSKVGSMLSEVAKRALPYIVSAFKKLGRVALSAGKSVAKYFGSKLISPFAKLGKAVAGVADKMKHLALSMARIAMYRAFRSLIKGITSALGEGIQNLYQWSKLMDEDFSHSMDMIATSGLYLKNSLAAMAEPIVNAVAPAIDALVDKIVELLNVINQLNAQITGQKTWTKAVKVQQEYAEAEGESTKKAKELQRTLLGFDEINRLNDDSSSSSSSSSDSTDYSSMFETVEEFTAQSDFVDNIKSSIEKGDWNGVGKLLAQKVNEAVNKVDWEKIGKKIGKSLQNAIELGLGFMDNVDWENIGSSVAIMFNNLAEQIDGYELGELLSSPFRAGVDALNGFVNDVNWSKLGELMREIIEGYFLDVDWSKLGSTIATALNGIGDAVDELAKTDWTAITDNWASGVNTLIAEFDAEKVGSAVGKFVDSAVKGLRNFVNKIDFRGMGEELASGLNGIVSNIDWSNITATLSDGVSSAFDTVIGFISTLDWAEVGSSIAELLEGINWEEIAGKIWKLLGNALVAVVKAEGGFFSEIFTDENGEIDFSSIMSGLAELNPFVELGTALGTSLTDAIAEHIDVSEIIETLKGRLLTAVGSISEAFQTKFPEIVTVFDGITELFSKLQEIAKKAKEVLMTLVDEALNKIKTKISETFAPIKEKIINAGKWIKEKLFDPLKTYFSDAKEEIKTKLKDMWENFSETSTSTIKNAFNSLFETIENKLNSFINSFNGLITKINSSIPGVNISTISPISLPRLASGTVIPPNYGEFMAVLGDSSETEIVSPVSAMKEAFLDAMTESGGKDATVVMNVDGATLGKAVVKWHNSTVKQTGNTPLLV